jgi:uncharacterized protein (DUF305 family)
MPGTLPGHPGPGLLACGAPERPVRLRPPDAASTYRAAADRRTLLPVTAPAPPAPPDDDLGDVPPTDEYEPAGWTTSSLVAAAVLGVLLAVVVVLGVRYTTTPRPGSVDVGFLQDMTYHHDQAVEIASIAAENGTDQEVRSFARETLVYQRYELGYMSALLEGWGLGTGDTDRTAMQWMGMGSQLGDMPGMQRDADVAAARTVTGPAADASFLTMMADHHRGGLHMAEYAMTRAKDPRVRDLARRMAEQQRSEIEDLKFAAQRLGVTL